MLKSSTAVRKFIRDINEKYKTTIILTTHDLDDIEQLCHRVIIINKGVIVEDGSLSELIDRLAPEKTIVVDFFDTPPEISRFHVPGQYARKETGSGFNTVKKKPAPVKFCPTFREQTTSVISVLKKPASMM